MSQLAASDRGGAADSLGQELTSANEVRRTVVRSLKIRRAGSTTVGGGKVVVLRVNIRVLEMKS